MKTGKLARGTDATRLVSEDRERPVRRSTSMSARLSGYILKTQAGSRCGP
jgi:hypothetical protein